MTKPERLVAYLLSNKEMIKSFWIKGFVFSAKKLADDARLYPRYDDPKISDAEKYKNLKNKIFELRDKKDELFEENWKTLLEEAKKIED